MEKENEKGIEVEAGDARAFYFHKGAKDYKKYLAKKGFVIQENCGALQRVNRTKRLGNYEQACGAGQKGLSERVLCQSWR